MRASKGKIMEILDSHAVVMNREGQFNRIKRKEAMRIGADVLYTSDDLLSKTNSKRGWIFNFKTQAAVAMLVLIVLVISQIAMPAAYAVVSLDINPSLEITVDESRKVVSINPINTEGDELLEAFVLNRSKDLHAVINELIELSSTMGYLTSENHNVILATAMIDKRNTKSSSNELMSEILDAIEETEYTFDFTLVSTAREAEDIKSAKSEGLSLGRYAMAKENFLPPGQEKKLEEATKVKPVDVETLETQPVDIKVAPKDEEVQKITAPPGQEKKVEDNNNVEGNNKVEAKNQNSEKIKPVPPGQENKEKNTPSKFVITEKKATQAKENNKGGGKGGGKGN